MIEAPQIIAPQPTRSRWVWAVLATIFAILLFQAIAGTYTTRPAPKAQDPAQDMTLRLSVLLGRMSERLRSVANDEATTKQFDKLGDSMSPAVSALVDRATTDPWAARYYAAFRTEQKRSVAPEYVKILADSHNAGDRAFAAVYTSKTLTKAQAAALAKQIPTTPFVNALARAHAFAKAGDKTELARIAPLKQGFVLLGAYLALLVLLPAGVALWVIYFVQRRSGKLAPLGHPVEPITDHDADALSFRGSQLITSFLVFGFAAGLIAPFLPVYVRTPVYVAAFIALVVFLFRVPVLGRVFSLARLGVTRQNLGKHILWGIGGWIAVLPVILIVVTLGSGLNKFFPQPHHPVQDILTAHPSPTIIIGVLLQASVLAPFWEEIMFRGCLFPAISKVLRSPWWGAAISSLMFASIHPQGVPLWLALGSIAGMNCFLAYQTKSLVPCMVLHAIHNTVALTATVLLFR